MNKNEVDFYFKKITRSGILNNEDCFLQIKEVSVLSVFDKISNHYPESSEIICSHLINNNYTQDTILELFSENDENVKDIVEAYFSFLDFFKNRLKELKYTSLN